MFKRMLIVLLITGFWSILAIAEGGEGKDEDPNGIKYYELFPNLVTNYVRPDGKIGFVSIGIQLKTKGKDHSEVLRLNKYLLQDAVIWLVRGQTEDQLKSVEHREELRQEILTLSNKTLEENIKKKDLVLDVLFTKYLWQ